MQEKFNNELIVKTTIQSYDQTVVEYDNNIKFLPPEVAFNKFCSYLDYRSYILDLGCGTGRDSNHFSNLGFKVLGVDLSRNMIRLASEKYPKIDFKILDIRSLNFKEETFHAIWASASLLHIPKNEISKVFTKLHEILKKEGILYLSLKKGEGEKFIPDNRYNGVYKFWAFYTLEEISKKLEENKFSILEKWEEKYPNNQYVTNPWLEIICRKI